MGKLRTEHIGVSKLTNALQNHIVLEVQNSRKIFIKNNRRYFLQVCKFIHLSTLISYQKVKWWHEWGEMKITMFFFNECDSKNVFVSLYIATKDKQLSNIFFFSETLIIFLMWVILILMTNANQDENHPPLSLLSHPL